MSVFEHWRKSSRSGGTDNCVEVATVPGRVGIRDSQDPCGPVLDVAAGGWAVFLAGIRQGRFDQH